jgi:hypothetical protein
MIYIYLNITGAFHAASQAIDAFVPTLHGPFPILQYTLEGSEDFVDSGSRMLTLNRDSEAHEVLHDEAAWGEYQILVVRKDAYQTRDDESLCCQKGMDMSQCNYSGYARYPSMIVPWGPALLPGWSKNVGTSSRFDGQSRMQECIRVFDSSQTSL